MIFNKPSITTVLFPVTLFLSLCLSLPAHGRDNVSFDKEAVFCSYFKISQEAFADQDIEELLMALGRPTFSNYKPAEIFTRQTIRQKRVELNGTIKRLSGPAPLKWHFECFPSKLRSGFSTYYLRKNLPFATPYIQSEISNTDLLAIIKKLRRVSKSRRFKYDEKVRIEIYLWPVKWENRLRARTMARQKTVFPLRYVFFKPLLVEVVPISWKPPSDSEIRQFRAMLSR